MQASFRPSVSELVSGSKAVLSTMMACAILLISAAHGMAGPHTLNPQPLPPGLHASSAAGAINPQPLPPRYYRLGGTGPAGSRVIAPHRACEHVCVKGAGGSSRHPAHCIRWRYVCNYL
jgi:hypothetical protein